MAYLVLTLAGGIYQENFSLILGVTLGVEIFKVCPNDSLDFLSVCYSVPLFFSSFVISDLLSPPFSLLSQCFVKITDFVKERTLFINSLYCFVVAVSVLVM